ncbi:MAG: sigma-54-dependent Fis family transcriptional regulator, partial [Lentisphaeria bacterium]|nr:sigma-54-dependent Fis family transcriptional regulator [Lentisphaeria bacterium]
MPERAKILIADDEYNTREALANYLKRRYDVSAAADGGEAIELLKKQDFDLVLTDLRMPEADGMSVLGAARSKANQPVCILLTAFGSISEAVQAVKRGAFDFLAKPIKLGVLEKKIEAALAAKHPQPDPPTTAAQPTSAPKPSSANGPLLPDDPRDPMSRVLATAAKAAPSRTTVLLTGESGSGKEVVARFIHDRSGRTGLFVPVHCAALTPTLLESELFGHEKDAYTGATQQRRGRFELADGGTLFLDEIGEISPETQIKLLRVLESRAFERVGGTETITVDARVVAATNRDLKKMVAEHTFREDLYYRLAVVTLELPPLRERRMEIPLLAEKFVREFARENQRGELKIAPELMRKLENHPWSGNIRELRNCLE